MSTFPDFPTFAHALWDADIVEYDPFPWQRMLAYRIMSLGRWPEVIDLPTAAGKTACMDIAVWDLARQADLQPDQRTAPRRIWFAVDRRIVVDQAYDRACVLASKLGTAREGAVWEIAQRLRRISGTDRPLAVARLRGGALKDDGWARLPSQPSIIASTVDQIGSRILFRGYGPSNLTASIFAGLAGNDSLILLDEAHCSVPFLQTMRSIAIFRGASWAERPLKTPFGFVLLSATPPPGTEQTVVFPGADRDKALDDPLLQKRISAPKPACLRQVKVQRDDRDPLQEEAVDVLVTYCKAGKRKIAAIVNRVATATSLAATLGTRLGNDAHVVLLTGRLRPFERDAIVSQWDPFLRSRSPEECERPVVVVATQCLEVGADFSFDAMLTEMASLDALRQRFGRLNRRGDPGEAPATILKRHDNGSDDPIYGSAIDVTWTLLQAAVGEGKVIDFGIQAIDQLLAGEADISQFMAPSPKAPFLFPAHLDLLCQTAPTPHPDPEVQLFLHGTERQSPDVRVVWRADLSGHRTGAWIETVSLCPPAMGEMLSVPLYRVRAWLGDPASEDFGGDVEGEACQDSIPGKMRPCVVWRGRQKSKSKVCRVASEIAPNDVVVVPAAYGTMGLCQMTGSGVGEAGIDLWERARCDGNPALRIHRAVFEPWNDNDTLRDLLDYAEDPACERDVVLEKLSSVVGAPEWLMTLLASVHAWKIEEHPDGGLVLFSNDERGVGEPDLFADDDDLTSAGKREVSIAQHTKSVERAVEKIASRCLSGELRTALKEAARWHDAGKLDERFQILLRNGNAVAAVNEDALAKSSYVPMSPQRRAAIRKASGLPDDFRHEMLSTQLAERYARLEEGTRELVLHLVASHHGYARPFAPVSQDIDPPAVSGRLGDVLIELPEDDRRDLVPYHRIDSGIAERFWHLCRRYGWWGLAYLEAVLRLGDWYGSVYITDEENT